MGDNGAILRARGVAKSYPAPGGRLVILDGIDLDLAAGEAVAIVGASGTGKSTLLHLLGLMDTPDKGTVSVGGEGKGIGFVFQFHHLLPEFDALENCSLPLRLAGAGRAEASARAREALASVGLADRAGHLPAALSGGEAQRVAIARALVGSPALVLADEPTGDLDTATARRVTEVLFAACRGKGRGLIVATHDAEVARGADRVLRLAGGRLAPVRKEEVE